MLGGDAQRKRQNDGKFLGRARVLVVATTSLSTQELAIHHRTATVHRGTYRERLT
jgi:hypothetical protein